MTIRQGDKIVAGVVSNTDYNMLDNKPSINNIILNGNFSLSDLGIQPEGDFVSEQKLTETLTNYVSKEDLSLKIADELALVENFTPTPYIISVPDQTSEKSIEELKREDRDLAIYRISWRIERYRQQSELNIKTDDSKQVYINLLKYVQYLRDIPQNKDFPEVEILTFEEYLTTL